MELYAHIMSMNSYFIVRLKDKSYIDDRYEITENDAEIELELTKERLKKFNNKLLINRVKRQKGIKQEYKVNQAHLIRKLKKYLPIMILNPTKEIIRNYTKKLIDSCTQSPNKGIKNPTTTRNKKKQRKFNINYKPT